LGSRGVESWGCKRRKIGNGLPAGKREKEHLRKKNSPQDPNTLKTQKGNTIVTFMKKKYKSRTGKGVIQRALI